MTRLKTLPDSLAQRVQALREALGITTTRLAERALLSIETVQDIEAGLELFLAPAVRLKLARALRVRPHVLEEVEKPGPQPSAIHALDPRLKQLRDTLNILMNNPNAVVACPQCAAPLKLQRFERLTLQEQPVTSYKLTCTACLFRYQVEV